MHLLDYTPPTDLHNLWLDMICKHCGELSDDCWCDEIAAIHPELETEQ